MKTSFLTNLFDLLRACCLSLFIRCFTCVYHSYSCFVFFFQFSLFLKSSFEIVLKIMELQKYT
ncbi:uncharacterized protein DS421_5g144310 [Arachis hypogaea]|nr:uncharacterized protein DS421_5g144310 [Arachis hypogaea]